MGHEDQRNRNECDGGGKCARSAVVEVNNCRIGKKLDKVCGEGGAPVWTQKVN